jgi:hypothetical protein
VIFIPHSESDYGRAIPADVKGAGVQNVSDIPNFSADGGRIGLVFDVDHNRFQINLSAASNS